MCTEEKRSKIIPGTINDHLALQTLNTNTPDFDSSLCAHFRIKIKINAHYSQLKKFSHVISFFFVKLIVNSWHIISLQNMKLEKFQMWTLTLVKL